MRKKWYLMFLFFVFTSIFRFSILYPADSKSSSERMFNYPEMLEENDKPPKGVWKKRIEKVDKALKNIQKKIEDPNSDISKKLFDCIKNALKNLYKPNVQGWDDIPQEFKELKVKLAKKKSSSDIKTKTKTKTVLMKVKRKAGVHPNVNQGTYHGVMHGQIIIYPAAFEPKNIKCLEGNLFHEIIHMACFTNEGPKNNPHWLGEKMAYACSHKIYQCASVTNSDDQKDKDYSKPDECNEKNCEDEKKDRKDVDEKDPSYCGDNADDNYSVADGVIKRGTIESDFLIYRNGYYSYMDNLISGIYFDGSESPKKLLEVSKTIVIPTGGLFNLENDATLRNTLQQYVFFGGTLIVFAQQYGVHLDKVVPLLEDEHLKTFGWREDQSCVNGSLYFSQPHPILSAQPRQKVSAAIDGYIDVYPSNSTIVLQRIKNRKPALLYYPFGNGTVILTSLFSDWASAHSQAPSSEKKIIRDLITFAKDPKQPIPMFNLEDNPNPSINLGIKIKNHSEFIASRVILKAYSPDRNRVLHEIQQNITLNPGQASQVPISLSLPTIQEHEYGICHVDFELLDENGFSIQFPRESTSGRFALYNVTYPFQPKSKCSVWVTAVKDSFYWKEPADLVLHVKNYSNEPITMDWYYDWTHQGRNVLPAITVPANSEISYPVQLDLPQRTFRNLNAYLEMFWLWYRTDENASYTSSTKGIYVNYPATRNSSVIVQPAAINGREPINYTLTTRNPLKTTLEDVEIKVYLEQRQWPDYQYTPIATVYETTTNFTPRQTFTQSLTYTHPEILPAGLYRLKMEITRPDQSTDTAVTNFSVVKSYMKINIESIRSGSNYAIIEKYLTIGKSYPFRAILINRAPRWGTAVPIFNGKCTLIVESETGEEAFRYVQENISIPASGSTAAAGNFLFHPPVPGKYFFRVIYEDETGTKIDIIDNNHFYTFKNYLRVYPNPRKDAYLLGETIDLNVEVKGSGEYLLEVTCEKEGFSEERLITLTPEVNNTLNENFAIPTTFANSFPGGLNLYTWLNTRMVSTTPDCTGAPGICAKGDSVVIKRSKITINDIVGQYGDVTARLGDPIDFNVTIGEGSGFITPLTGQLTVSSSAFGFEDTQVVTISPTGGNNFAYNIPVPNTLAAGNYGVFVSFKVEERELIRKYFPIAVPAPDAHVTEPPEQLSAGEPMVLILQNPGGKNGNYDYYTYLKDSKGKTLLEYSSTFPIDAGSTKEISLSIPAEAVSGTYTLYQKTKETNTGKEITHYSQHQLTGLSATLTTQTGKDKYFDNETVSGTAEITSGPGAIHDGILKTEIVKYVTSGGISEVQSGEFAQYNQVMGGTGKNGKLYLFTKTHVFQYDPAAETTNLFIDLTTDGTYCNTLYLDSANRLWLGTGLGVYMRETNGTWTHFTTADGLISNYIRHIVEYQYPDLTSAIWVATSAGISEYKDGTWTSYTTAGGLPSNSVLRFAKEGSGDLWISTSNGLIKYNGSDFAAVGAPFGSEPVYYKLSDSSDGSVWMATWDKIYRYKSGTWDIWLQQDIAYGLYVAEISTDDSAVWFRGDDTLVRYDGNFTSFSANQEQRIHGVQAIIPFDGPGIYFAYNSFLKSGLLSYNDETWESLYIGKDTDRFLGEPTCITQDDSGTLWVGTVYGISCFTGDEWQNHITLADGQTIGYVYGIQAVPGNKIYAATETGIILITPNQVEAIPQPPYIEGSYEGFGVDNLSRVWTSYHTSEPSILSYYDDGQWHEFHYSIYNNIVSDGSGGVWMSSYNNLLHVKSNLSQVFYSSTNSPLGYNEILSLYVDSKGKLWIIQENDSGGNMKKLLSFNGSNWTDYNNLSGYPESIRAVTENISGEILILAGDFNPGGGGGGEPGEEPAGLLTEEESPGEGEINEDQTNAAVYRIDGSQFSLFKDGFNTYTDYSTLLSPGFTAIDGVVYCIGDLKGHSDAKLLRISSDSGGVEQTVWTSNYPVNLAAGAAHTLDLTPGLSLTPGLYNLKTQLLANNDQILADNTHAFVVRGTQVSVILGAEPAYGRYVKQETPLAVSLEILNNTPDNKNNLTLTVNTIAPDGTETQVLTQSINLTPGQSDTQTISFNANETGTWKITAEIAEETTVLSQSEMILEVVQPAVSAEFITPVFSDDSPFNMDIKFLNHGQIDASVVCRIPEAELDQALSLKPGEERIIRATDTISADKTYTLTLEGDLQSIQTKTVKYAYVEQLALDVLPAYREGIVTIGFNLLNNGYLPFSDDIQFRLFSLGSTEPIAHITRAYNLTPGDAPITDTFTFDLQPGSYILKTASSRTPEQETLFTVNPAGLGTVTAAAASRYPVGINSIDITLTNIDSTPGHIPVNIELKLGETVTETQVLSETRTYYLEAGETLSDEIAIEFATAGDYTLTISGPKLTAPISQQLHVLPLNAVENSLSIGTPDGGNIPVAVSIVNSGYNDFKGTLVIEVEGNVHQQAITVSAESQVENTIAFDTQVLNPGSKEVYIYLEDDAGHVLNETTGTVSIFGPDIKIIDFPQDLSIDAGEYQTISLTLKNEGNASGEVQIKMTAFDNLHEERQLVLAPGETVQVTDVVVDVAPDIPSGSYPFHYTLSGSGVIGGSQSGNFNFTVNGVSMDIDASLDKDSYKEGEIARLTININSQNSVDIPLEAVVNWGEFSDRRTFTMTGQSDSLQFDIPLNQTLEDKVFYGIYHEGGKGIHLNDIYIRLGDTVTAVTDKQVYNPGDVVHAIFESTEPGILTAEAFNEIQTLVLSGSQMVDFAIPASTPGGTQGIRWDFKPVNPSGETLSGTLPFDVAGLILKMARVEMEESKYMPGETLKVHYTIESNFDETLTLKSWILMPSGEHDFLGEKNVSVFKDRQVNVDDSYTFTTIQNPEAGTHRVVFTLYRADDLITSGSAAFEVGDAVLMGVTTDHFEYRDGNEDVNVTIDYFGEGTAQLEMYLDEELVNTQSLSINGVGRTEISLTNSQISGGSHSLKVLLTKDGLTSTKTTSFIYGTHLPDLVATMAESLREGLNYTYKVEVSNNGKTASATTTLVFIDNGTTVETLSIPGLQPGTSHETTINWSGSGKAGTHEFTFEVDQAHTVKEFSEANNRIDFTEEVPVIFYTLEVDPVFWPANSDITIITRLINNQTSVTPVNLDLSLTNDSTNEVIFQRAHVEELPAFGSKSLSDPFNTDVYPAGAYTLSQTLGSAGVDLEKSISVFIETTKAIDATLSLQPQRVSAGVETQVEATMSLTNAGNVALEDETVMIEVFNKDNQEVVQAEEILISIPLAGQITETKILTLNLVEGNYEIRLKYLEEILASADLVAAAALKHEKGVGLHPRVLVMNLGNHVTLQKHGKKGKHGNKGNSELAFITGLLQSQGIEFEVGQWLLDSFVKLHKGHSNVNIVLGHGLGRKLRDELRERVWRGEGLIFICDKPMKNFEWMDFLGVKIKPLPGKDREKHITLLPCPLGSGGEVELVKRNHLGLDKVLEDVTIIAQTQQRKHPVMAFRKYGNGYVLVSVVPLEFKSGVGDMSQLLVNVVNHFSSDVYNRSDLTRIIPVELVLTNESLNEETITVKEILPYGVETYDYTPEPEEGEELKWTLVIPAAGEEKVSYWLKLPDQIGSYEVKTELYKGETKLEDVSLSFDVAQEVLSRIDELIVELESIDVSGKDGQLVRKAVHRLQKVRSRMAENFIQLLANVFDTVEAAGYLGEVKTADVSSQRLKVQDIMVFMGRRLYEKVIQWGASGLTPFIKIITSD